MTKRLALCQGGDDDSNESRDQKYADAMQCEFVTRPPKVNRDPLEKLRDGPLAHPDEESVENARRQNEFRAQLAVLDLHFRVVDTDRDDIVSSVDEYYVHEPHAREEWQQGEEHDPVLAEQLVASHFPAGQASEDDNGGEACGPPAV
jgi:hypothetical protein